MDLLTEIKNCGGEIIFDQVLTVQYSPHSPVVRIKCLFVRNEDCYYKDIDGNESLINEITKTSIAIKNSIIQRLKLMNMAKPTHLKQFDLEAAKKGAKVITKSGKPVELLYFEREVGQFPIVAIIEKKKVANYTIDGKFYYSETPKPSKYDLYMA